MKEKYHGKFNFYGQVIHVWRWASNPLQARRRLLEALSRKVGYEYPFLSVYYNGNKDNIRIGIEK